ncbi:unnamed protein product [Ranitomeya imitator]|uniref:Uncharacterized protein n=1 Tax=Ranitomeya imitator TaxID=111125 RepID=A0ABN9MP54_9NEOB|nr:unnamed protein product [Ranitomeya imitator]
MRLPEVHVKRRCQSLTTVFNQLTAAGESRFHPQLLEAHVKLFKTADICQKRCGLSAEAHIKDHQCPEFRVAYTDELGPNPTLNDLQSLVVENKQRPIPRNWRKNLQLFETLWETLEDCWDPDSEARLTAQCAEQRLRNLLSAPFSVLPGNGT